MTAAELAEIKAIKARFWQNGTLSHADMLVLVLAENPTVSVEDVAQSLKTAELEFVRVTSGAA